MFHCVTRYALLLVFAISLLSARSALAEETPPPAKGLTFRLAEMEKGFGLTEAQVPGKDESIYLHPQSILTAKDITSVGFGPDQSGAIAVTLQINPEAAQRLQRTTRENLQKPLAVVLDGKVITAPIIRAEISDRFTLTGNFSDEDLTHLFKALVLHGRAK